MQTEQRMDEMKGGETNKRSIYGIQYTLYGAFIAFIRFINAIQALKAEVSSAAFRGIQRGWMEGADKEVIVFYRAFNLI